MNRIYVTHRLYRKSPKFPYLLTCRRLSGKLWYLQHNYVGGTIFYHQDSDSMHLEQTVWSKISLITTSRVSRRKCSSWWRHDTFLTTGPLWEETSWWRHQMEIFSALLVLCAGNSPVPVNSPHKSQWSGSLMFSLIYAWINDWANNH